MAHFADVDDSNIVVRVLVVPDEQEHRGHEYLAEDCHLGGRWIQTSYNNKIRGVYAGIPGVEFTLDGEVPPIPRPGIAEERAAAAELGATEFTVEIEASSSFVVDAFDFAQEDAAHQ